MTIESSTGLRADGGSARPRCASRRRERAAERLLEPLADARDVRALPVSLAAGPSQLPHRARFVATRDRDRRDVRPAPWPPRAQREDGAILAPSHREDLLEPRARERDHIAAEEAQPAGQRLERSIRDEPGRWHVATVAAAPDGRKPAKLSAKLPSSKRLVLSG